MNNINLKYFMMILIVCITIHSCTYQEPITKRSQLMDPAALGPIFVLTKDSTLYNFVAYHLTDSLLQGVGKMTKAERESDFSGALQLSDIVLIQGSNRSPMRTTMIVGGAVVFLAAAQKYLTMENTYTATAITGHYSPSTGEHSCPTVYSWNGDRYILEGEAIAVGLGKALEIETTTLLPSLKPDQGGINIRISNERLETHYINKLNLVAFETEQIAQVVLDDHDTAWPVYDLTQPIIAYDNNGRNILSYVNKSDGEYWESDMQAASVLKDFEDFIEVEFHAPKDRTECSVIINAINTGISDIVFGQMFHFLGDETLAFIHAAEEDPEMIQALKKWIDESSLKIEILQDGIWHQAGILKPEANAVSFKRAIRIQRDLREDRIRLRLRCLRDVWKFDAIQVDWTDVQPLVTQEIPFESVVGPFGDNVKGDIHDADSKYVIMLPPQHIDLQARHIKPTWGKKIVYGLQVKGYLYEWVQELSQSQPSEWAGLVPRGMKVESLKHLLSQRQIFLPPIYAEWKIKRIHPFDR